MALAKRNMHTSDELADVTFKPGLPRSRGQPERWLGESPRERDGQVVTNI
jgi:hypothetical protein